jgi:hypothetical protein
MVHLRLVAGTDVSGVAGTEKSFELSEAAASRLEEKAREALRNLRPLGQEKTVGELRDELSRRCRKRSPRGRRLWAVYDRVLDVLHPTGIFLRHVQPDEQSWDIEFRCVVGWPDELVAAHPEFKPYAFVLEDLEF